MNLMYSHVLVLTLQPHQGMVCVGPSEIQWSHEAVLLVVLPTFDALFVVLATRHQTSPGERNEWKLRENPFSGRQVEVNEN